MDAPIVARPEGRRAHPDRSRRESDDSDSAGADRQADRPSAMTPSSPDREARAARNEDLFRRLNERLHVLASVASSSVLASDLPESFICECAQATCSRVLELSPPEYRHVREVKRRFLVFPDEAHTSPDLEVVIERHDRYWIVEKIGEAGEAADALADASTHLL